MNSIKWILFLSLVIVAGCRQYEDDDFSVLCPDAETIGPYLMLDETKALIQFETNINRLVFADENNTEKYFNVSFVQTGSQFSSDFNSYPCSDDPEQTVFYNVLSEREFYSFFNNEYGASIDLEFSTRFIIPPGGKDAGVQFYDQLFFAKNFNGYAQEIITLDKRNSINVQETIAPLQTFEFRGQTFQDVYYMSFLPAHVPSLYYSKADGIIGLKSGDDSVSLKFLRAEYF